MKVAVKDLLPNPYRNIKEYPIIEEKVSGLADSIKDSTFWDNIIGRKKSDGKYEIAYGHHRLVALKKAGIKEIDLIVRELSDRQMIKIMANENMHIWKTDPNVTRETVRVAKEELGKELKDDKSNFRKYKSSKRSQKSQYGEVTSDDIQWYLGGAWKKPRQVDLINQALTELKVIDDGIIDEEDIKPLTAPAHGKALIKAIKEHFPKKPASDKEKHERKKVVKKIVTDLETGEIRAKDVDFAMRMERSDLIQEKIKMKTRLSFPELKIQFDSLIDSCQCLENEIQQFKGDSDSYKFDPKRWERFTTGYDVLMLVKALQWLWDFMQKDEETQKQIT